MRQQRRFTRALEDEAVRLALTSGRTRRSVAEDLGVGLSTLTRWIGRSSTRSRSRMVIPVVIIRNPRLNTALFGLRTG